MRVRAVNQLSDIAVHLWVMRQQVLLQYHRCAGLDAARPTSLLPPFGPAHNS
jgi:hypothetical protein